MKPDFKIFDYVSFPSDKGSDEIREGFIFKIHSTQIDIVSARKKEGVTFGDFGFHKKYMEKERWEEIKHVEISRDIGSWKLYQVCAWAMIRLHQTFGDFMTDNIKQITQADYTEAEKITGLIQVVRDITIQQDRKKHRKV
jgi:hypothetical protein